MAYLSWRPRRGRETKRVCNSKQTAGPRSRRASLELLEPRFALAAGDLVPGFGDGGKVTTEFEVAQASFDTVADVARTADGKYFLVGETLTGHGPVIAVASLLPDGAPDDSFGIGGKVLTAVSSRDDHPTAVAIQPDGKIVVAGHTRKIDTNFDLLLLRYNVDGTLDAGFGSGGIVTLQVGQFHCQIEDVIVQADGKIIVAGVAAETTGGYDFAVIRYLNDGTIDSGFGDDGVAFIDLGTADDHAFSLAIDSQDRILVTGRAFDFGAPSLAGIVRLTTSGELDESFADDGIQLVPFNEGGQPGAPNDEFVAVLQADDKLLVSGPKINAGGEHGINLIRLTESGELDGEFGSGGQIFEFEITSEIGGPFPLAVHPDGRILVSGPHYLFSQLAFIRYDSTGARDQEFGFSGVLRAQLNEDVTWGDLPVVALLEPFDGYAIAFRRYSESTRTDFGVARFDQNGLSLVEFGENGIASVNISDVYSEGVLRDAAILPDHATLAVGDQLGTSGRPAIGIAKHLASGELDVAFGTEGRVEIPLLSDSIAMQARQVLPLASGESLVLGRSFGLSAEVTLSRIEADGSLDPDFGIGGTARYTVDPSFSDPAAALAFSDGSTLIIGTLPVPDFFFLLRTKPDGSLNSAFGFNGVALQATGQNFVASALAVQRDGKILVAGSSQPFNFGGFWKVITVVRLHPDGSLDMSFGTGGMAFVDYIPAFSGATDIAIQRDGRILVVGRGELPDGYNMIATRLLPDGQLDVGFGSGGRIIVDLSPSDDVQSVGLLDDGRFYIAGSITEGEQRKLALLGYLPDGTPDAAFADNGKFVATFSSYATEAAVVRVFPSGDFLVGGTTTTESAKLFSLAKIEGFGAIQLPWRNHDNPFNVDDDAGDNVVPADAIAVIDALNLATSHYLPVLDSHVSPAFYLDVNGDNQLTPADAIMVIDYLNLMDALDGEGESAVAQSQETDAAEPQSTEVGFLWNQDTRSVPASSLDSGKSAPLSFAAARATKRQEMRISADWPVEQSNLPLTLDAKTTAEPPMLLELDELLECLAVGHLGLSLD